MKRRAFLPLVAAALAAAAPAIAQTPVAQDRLRAVLAHGVLRIGTCGDYKPFTYRDPVTATYSGIDIDAANDFARSLGVRTVFVATTWPTLSADLLADSFDLAMGGISKTPERARIGLLSDAYDTDGKVPLVRAADRNAYQSLAQIDRPGVRVAVNPGGTNQKFVAANLTHAHVIVVEKNLDIPGMLARGDADVMITDGIEATLASNRDPRLAALDLDHPFTHDEKAYFLHAGDETLARRLDAWIATATSNGSYARWRAMWMGRAAA